MAEILTTKLKNDTTRMFYQDILDNEFYFAVSSIATEELTRINAVNSLSSKNEFKENILFGKRVINSDVKFMIKYYPWQKDELYTQYDDKADLENSNFYSVVGPTNNDSGDYRVYKCLSNNNGANSTVPPNYNPTTSNQIYSMPDGYTWKYMYYLTEQQFEAYNAVGYIPLIGTFDINPDPAADANNVITGSEVSSIFVENYVDNNGYPFVNLGIVRTVNNDNTLTVSSSELSDVANYYSGMTIYCITPQNISYIYVIDTYVYDLGTELATVKVIGDPKTDGVVNGSSCKILPTIEIKGDGEGAKAVPRIVAGKITSVEVINSGKNYNNITVTVIDPTFDFDPEDPLTIDVRASLRPILSPLGRHNFDLIDELHCRHILLYGYITESDNNKIGKTNTYSVVGVIKNPTFTPDPITANTASPEIFDNRISIVTDDYTKLAKNTIVTQRDVNNDILFSGKIHDIKASANTIYISEYMGPQTNIANNDISLDLTKDLVNETGQRIQINTPVANNVIESRYTQRSGTIYFMEDFFPLERAETSREEYKLVLEF